MKILSRITYYGLVLAIAAVGILLLLTMSPAGGFEAKIVKSGSMEPTIQTGAMVFIRPSEVYKKGDVITFGADTKVQIPTTHRIIEVVGSGASTLFVTKGDANDAADPAQIRLAEVKGKVVFSLPYVGYVLDFAKKPLGFILLVGIPAFIVIVDELRKIWIEIKKMRRKSGGESDVRSESYRNCRNLGNVLDLRMKPKIDALAASSPQSSWKILLAIFMVFGTVIGLGGVKSTVSYYNEREVSSINTLTASDDFGLPFASDLTPFTLKGELEEKSPEVPADSVAVEESSVETEGETVAPVETPQEETVLDQTPAESEEGESAPSEEEDSGVEQSQMTEAGVKTSEPASTENPSAEATTE